MAVARSSTFLVGRCHQTMQGALLFGSSKLAAGLANPLQNRLTPSWPNSLATYSLSAGAYSTQWPSASITGCPNRALISADPDDFPLAIFGYDPPAAARLVRQIRSNKTSVPIFRSRIAHASRSLQTQVERASSGMPP